MAERTSTSPTGSPKNQSRSPASDHQAPPADSGHLAADDTVSDTDSVLDAASIHSETTSLSSSVAKYRHENGRTYHGYKDGAYVLPNDEAENERLDLQHNLYALTYDSKLYLSPAGSDKPLKRVLDAGCGTGIWALDFADDHPETEVIGVDLSPIQPSFVPPNLRFVIDDLEAPWAHGAKFDFIHGRMLSGSLADWPKFAEQAYENLESGGWLELSDIAPVECDDGTLPADCPFQRWTNEVVQAAEKIGRSMYAGKQHKQHLTDAGFTNVTEIVLKWPINRWPRDPKYKEIGMWAHESILSGIDAISLALFTRVLGWSNEEQEVLKAGVRADLRNPRYHGYWPIHVVYGQKP